MCTAAGLLFTLPYPTHEELEYSDNVVVELDDICVASEEYFMDADVSVIHVAL